MRACRMTIAAGALACSVVGACGPARPTVASPPPVVATSSVSGSPAPPAEPAAGDAAVTAAEGFVRRDINHVLVTGQSLAVGVSGAPALSLTQPFGNLMFNTGVMAGREELESFEPLVEGDTIPGSKAVVETMSSAFANLVSELARADGDSHDILVSVHASGAKPYLRLKRGTKAYENGMAQVAAARDIAKKLGKSYVVRAVANVHGESDHAEKSTRYLADLLEWQSDYEKDIKALTGQAEPVPMFHSQISSWTRMMKGTETSAIPAAQLAAHLQSQGKIVLVGPK